MSAPVELVQGVPLFADLDRKELQGLATSMKERTFRSGQTIASEGQSGIGFFVIAEGTANVSQGGEDRATLGPGDYFGEIALIDDGLRTASVTAVSELKAYGLTSWEFRPLVESNASIAWKLLKTMAARLREAEGRSSRA
jgi:CRP/FNR family transcriptional regulator, cyclic AMP receptor protein